MPRIYHSGGDVILEGYGRLDSDDLQLEEIEEFWAEEEARLARQIAAASGEVA